MDIKKYIKKLSKVNPFILLAITFIVGAGLLTIAVNQINSQKAQIATLQTTIKKDNDTITSLTEDNKLWEDLNHLNEITATITPTPITNTAPQFTDNLPPGCDVSINAYMKIFNNRAMVNQLMKRDRPECAY